MKSSSLAPLTRLLLALLVGAWCVLGSGAAMADALDDATRDAAIAAKAVSVLQADLAELEESYQEKLARVADLKGDAAGWVRDMELKTALREARGVAESLNGLAVRLRSAQEEERASRTHLMAALDTQIAALETELSSAPMNQQLALIGQLEALQRAREDQRRGLSASNLEPISVPNLAAFESDDPEQLLAAVDELEDNREKIKNQLAEVDERIADLERRRRVRSFAEDAADEAHLFAEEQRSVRIKSSGGGSESDGGVASGTTTSKSDSGATTAPTNAASPDADGTQASPPPDGGPGAEYNGAGPSDERDSDDPSAWASDDLGAMAEPGVDPTPVVPQPEVPAAEPGLPVLTVGTPSDGVERYDADLGVVVPMPGVGQSAGGAKGELSRLKSRRAALQGSLDDIATQQRRLRDEAKELEADYK